MNEPASHRNRSLYSGDRYRERTLTGDPSSAAGSLLHRLLESRRSEVAWDAVLEVGANRAEHVSFVQHPWTEYVMLDLTAPGSEIIDGLPAGARFVAGDAHHLPFPEARFDRSLMTCVLHHLEDPELALEELRRVTRPGGRVSILLPNDPGIAYRTVRRLTSGRRASRAGAAAEERLSHAREHRNHYDSLATILRHVFRADIVAEKHFPTGLPAWNLNLVTVFQVTRND
jgi:phosphatidylethanolamine/phosphatidyl-N-methylethanolamine N-methyltransferase